MKPFFTIITVCYNSAATITRTIQSVLNQSFNDYEYWIIDGLSTDSTIDIVQNFKSQYNDKIFFISEKDAGIYDAMNKGIARAKGQIIGIVNSDDWLEPDALQKVFQVAQNYDNNKYKIYCGWMYFHYKDGSIKLLKTDKKRHEKYIKGYKMGIRHPATFVGTEVYKRIGCFDAKLKVLADLDFIYRCSQANIDFQFIFAPLTNMSDGGISNNPLSNIKTYYNDLMAFYRKYAKSKLECYYLLIKRMSIICAKIIIPQRLVKFLR